MGNYSIIRNEGSSNVAKVSSRHESLIRIFLVAEFYLNTLNLKLITILEMNFISLGLE